VPLQTSYLRLSLRLKSLTAEILRQMWFWKSLPAALSPADFFAWNVAFAVQVAQAMFSTQV
jgi:hypothetical protein